LCIGSDRRSKPDRRSVFERLSPCNRFFSSDRVSTPLRRSLPKRLSAPVRLSSSFIDASPLFLQDTLRPNKLARISCEQDLPRTAWGGRCQDRAKMFKIHGRTKKDQEALALQHTILVNRLGRDVVA
jgi:hypothetical protein